MSTTHKRSPLELRVWHFYTEEEKSLTILNGFKNRMLLSEDVQSFLLKDRLNTWSQWGFPAALFSSLYFTGVLKPYLAYKYPIKYLWAVPALITGLATVGWLHYSPFYVSLQKEKEHLLDLLDTRIGVKMKALNDIVPRTWTCQEIHRQLRESYNSRNGLFTNILYPSEEAQAPLVDISTYSFKHRRDKLVK